MQRYHQEKHIAERRVKTYRQLTAVFGDHPIGTPPETGRFRKSLRAGGCGQSRCKVCHSDKFPKRIPTRKEQQARRDEREPVE